MADVHSSSDPARDPSKDGLRAEVAVLRQRVAELEQDKSDDVVAQLLDSPEGLELGVKSAR